MWKDKRRLGIKQLGKLDWERRLNELIDLKQKNVRTHDVVVGKIDKKVPLQTIMALAQARGLACSLTGTEENGQLHIGKRVPKPAQPKPIQPAPEQVEAKNNES